MLSVTLFIGGEEPRRKRNLIEVLRCINSQTYRDFEVILVEQRFGDEKVHELFKLTVNKYVCVRNTLDKYRDMWNASWLLNIGAKHASGEKILQIDGDVVFGENFFQKVHDCSKKAFICWNELYRLNKTGTKLFMNNPYPVFLRTFNKTSNDDQAKYIDLGRHYGQIPFAPTLNGAAGAIVCFDRNFYFKCLGGRNEWFMGWGGTDNDMSHRWSALLGEFHTMKYTVYHLYHPYNKVTHPTRQTLLRETISNPLRVCQKIIQAGVGKLENPTLFRRDD